MLRDPTAGTARRRTALLAAVLVLAVAACTPRRAERPPTRQATTRPPTTAPSSTTPTSPPPTPPVIRAERPNVLVILTDDQRAGTLQVMPKTRALFGDAGTFFDNAFVTTPVCCPSRATILSGRYVHDNGVRGNGDALKLDHDLTIERYLQEAGYGTAIVGKFLNSWPLDQDPPHFDRWSIFNHGYNRTTWNIQGEQRRVTEYSTTFIGDQAVADLQAFEQRDARPWFLFVAPSAPHDPWTPEPKYAGARLPGFVRSPAMTEADTSDKPAFVQDVPHLSVATIVANRADQLRTLMSVDDLVARLFDTLDTLDEEPTLAFFLSDNGFLWGEHGIAGDRAEGETTRGNITGKRYPYTQSIRVPFLVRYPGHVEAGVVDEEHFVANVDIAPTIAEVAGAVPDVPFDGRSILSNPRGSHVFLEYFLDPLYPQVPDWASIRTGAQQYVAWFDPQGRVIFRELYDLRDDPFQLDNLMATPNPPDVSAFDAEIRRDLRCHGTTGSTACP